MLQPFGPRLDGFHAVSHQLADHLVRRADAHFDQLDRERAQLRTPEAIARWQQRTRDHFLAALGQLPGPRCELATRVTGSLERERYRIDKVVYQSLPDWPVTASLYIPHHLTTPAPAVLFLCGHGPTAKAYPTYQRVCSVLAKNGFVVLAIDPLGQGERVQCLDRTSGAQVVSAGTTQHSYMGLALTLAGRNLARYMVWDAMRGVDLLTSLPQVDAARIGLTGNSGGGTQSCYTMLLEPRIAAAAPGTYVSSRRRYFRAMQPHDAEQNLFNAIPHGLDHADFLIGFAPKPTMVLAVDYDFFPLDGTHETMERVRPIYESLEAADQLHLGADPQRHGYTDGLRDQAVRFLTATLNPQQLSSLDLAPDPLLETHQLHSTRTGQILLDLPDLPDLLQQTVDSLPTPPALSPQQIAERVRSIVVEPRTASPLYPRVIAETNDLGVHWEKIFFVSEPDVLVSGIFVKPQQAQGRLPATVLLIPGGTNNASDGHLLTRWRRYWLPNRALLLLDVRGEGAVTCDHISEAERTVMFGSLFKLCYDAWMLGDHMAAMRAYDVTRSFAYLRSRSDVDADQLQLHAAGDLALPGLLAAVADGSLVRCEFEGLPTSYADHLREGYYDRAIINEWTSLHGMLNWCDLPQLLAVVPTGAEATAGSAR